MRYKIGESAIVYTTLYDENDNLITGASITGDLLKPDGSVSGPYILDENTNFPGLYSIKLSSSILNQTGHYTMRLMATDFPVQFVSFFVGAPSGAGIYKLSINCKDQNDNVIPDCLVSLRVNDTIISTLLTDISGHAEFNVEQGTYDIYVFKANYVFTKQTISVNSDTTIDITGTALILPAPDIPGLCRVYIRSVDLGLNAVSGIDIYVNYDVPEEIGSNVGIDRWDKLTTDNEGIAYFDAPQGSNVLVRIPKARVNVKIKIPTDKNSVYLTDLFEAL
jgi:hypothetical protein